MSDDRIYLKDWRGQEFGPGSTVIYCTAQGSSSAQMTEGKVTDIFRVFRDDDWAWKRLAPGEEAPFRQQFNHKTRKMEPIPERRKTELRVKVKVTRESNRYGSPHTEGGKVGKEVTLIRTDHITVVSASTKKD